MRHFCTYFDSRYLVKGLALYRSLVRHGGVMHLWVLCLDDLTYRTLSAMALPGLTPIALADFEAGDTELLEAKGTRSMVEYYFTCTPSLPLYILSREPAVDAITYLDADLYFFASVDPIEEEFAHGSVLIVGHRFPARLKHLESAGIFNVSYLSFRRDQAGLTCLQWWRARCLEWCYDRQEDGRYADQQYLDDWPARFRGVVVLQHPGAGLALWNIEDYPLSIAAGCLRARSAPVVFFHFHGLHRIGRWLYDPNLARYGVCASPLLKRSVYSPYLRECRDIEYLLAPMVPPGSLPFGPARVGNRTPPSGNRLCRIGRTMKQQYLTARQMLGGNLWVVARGHIL